MGGLSAWVRKRIFVRSLTARDLLVVAFLILAFTSVWMVVAYRSTVAGACPSFRDSACADAATRCCNALCDSCHALAGRPPPLRNAIFFAVQTLTTTGYGSEVFMQIDGVQSIATAGMIAGALGWSLFTAALFSVLTAGAAED